MQCLQLDKSVHYITDLPLTSYVRREFDEPELMTYFHRATQNWVLGRWISRVHGVIKELLIVGRSPGEFTRENVRQLRRMLGSSEGSAKIRRVAREQEAKFLANQIETQELWNDQKARLRRRLPGLQGQHPCLQGPRT